MINHRQWYSVEVNVLAVAESRVCQPPAIEHYQRIQVPDSHVGFAEEAVIGGLSYVPVSRKRSAEFLNEIQNILGPDLLDVRSGDGLHRRRSDSLGCRN